MKLLTSPISLEIVDQVFKMVRRRYRRYRRRTRYSPNITRIGPSSFNIPAQSRDVGIVTLIENQSYDPNRSNNIITVKNPELSIEFEANKGCSRIMHSLYFIYSRRIHSKCRYPNPTPRMDYGL